MYKTAEQVNNILLIELKSIKKLNFDFFFFVCYAPVGTTFYCFEYDFLVKYSL